jgi:hypothetical protein
MKEIIKIRIIMRRVIKRKAIKVGATKTRVIKVGSIKTEVIKIGAIKKRVIKLRITGIEITMIKAITKIEAITTKASPKVITDLTKVKTPPTKTTITMMLTW